MGQPPILTKTGQSGPDTGSFLPIGARMSFAPDFGKRFIIFADAEEEFDWNAPFDRTQTATKTIADLVPATARFNAAGVKPVYLCDYPVVDNPESGAILSALVAQGQCDVGTQLHPWVNPPFDEEVTGPNSYTGNLPLALQKAKLIALTERIEAVIGVRPTVYRAGRYGLGPQTMTLLAEAGYKMDVSVRALFDYSVDGGPDYSAFPVWPWQTPEGPFELPLSSAWTGTLRNFPGLHRSARVRGTNTLRGAMARTGLLSRVPLTPEGVPLADALEAIRMMHGDGADVFSLSFHTPSVAIGHTPYVRDAADLKMFWDWWDAVFALFSTLGVLPVSYGDLVAAMTPHP
jgi:hypothetical protein